MFNALSDLRPDLRPDLKVKSKNELDKDASLVYYTPAQVAEILQLDTSTILKMCRDGRFPHVRISRGERGTIRISAADLGKFLRRNQHGAGQHS